MHPLNYLVIFSLCLLFNRFCYSIASEISPRFKSVWWSFVVGGTLALFAAFTALFFLIKLIGHVPHK
jgi:hypothetical protein